MKTRLLVGVVIAAHCAAVGGVFLIQGCGTPTGGEVKMDEPVVPVLEERPVATRDRPVLEERPVVTETRSWPAQTTTYVVKPGDTISTIAVAFGLSVSDIVSLNGMANPNLIRPGQKLVLPGDVDVSRSVARPTRKKALTVPAGGTEYIVKSGDCLSKIAARFGMKTAALKKANNLTSNLIRIGQRLVIPGRGATPAPANTAPPEVDLDTAPAGAPTPTTETQGPPVSHNVHIVEQGEDIYSVAMSESVSVAELKRLNGLTGDENLKPGQRLLVPVKGD